MDIRFIDIRRYLGGSLKNLCNQFKKITQIKGDFPHKMNLKSNYNLSLPTLPPLNQFIEHTTSADEEKRITDWWNENNLTPWDFNETIMSYCDSDVQILREASLYFIEENIDFERRLQILYPDIMKNIDTSYHKNFLHPYGNIIIL